MIRDCPLERVLPVGNAELYELVDVALLRLPENLREPDGDNVEEYGPIGEVTRLRDDANLLPLPAKVAVIVGVISVLVIVVAACAPLRLGLKVGLFLDANGLIIGVKVLFLVENVNRDFFFEISPSSPSSTSSSSSSSSPSSSSSEDSVAGSSDKDD